MTHTVRLPDSWASATLPDLVSANGVLADGDWVETKDQDPDGDVRLTQLADVGDGAFRDRSSRFMTSRKAAELNCTFLEKGDVMIARMPDPLGRACLFPGSDMRSVTAVDVCIVRPGTTDVSKRWLMHTINSPEFRLSVSKLQSGSTRKRISKKNLCTISLPVPPTAEQQRIVEAIESYLTRLDDAVASLERVQRNLNRHRASVLKAAVEGRLVPTEAELARQEGRSYEPADVLLEHILAERKAHWIEDATEKTRAKAETKAVKAGKPWTPEDSARTLAKACKAAAAKYKEPEAPDTSDLPDLPEGWCWATADQLLTRLDGGNSATARDKTTSRRVLRSSAVRQSRIDFNDHRYLEDDAPLKADGHLKEGDLLFTRLSGSLTYVGNCAIVPPLGELTYEFPDRLFRGRLGNLVNPVYFHHCLAVPSLREQLESAAKSAAGHQRIGLDDLRGFAIPMPPMAEQHRIATAVEEALSTASGALSTVKLLFCRTTRLRQSILRWAFTGKLVAQDPNDEPASVLLGRIRATRSEVTR